MLDYTIKRQSFRHAQYLTTTIASFAFITLFVSQNVRTLKFHRFFQHGISEMYVIP